MPPFGSIVLAARFGLVTLIALGYRGLAFVFLGIFVSPVMTVGMWQLFKQSSLRPSASVF